MKTIFMTLFLAFLSVSITLKAQAVNGFEFLSELERKDTATVKDLVILVSRSYKDLRDDYTPAQWHVAFVKLGWMDEGLNFDDPCSRGQVGRLVAGRLNLSENIFLKVFGPTERYGFREIVRLEFLKGGYPNQYLGGSVLMNVQSRSTAWLKTQSEAFQASYKKRTDRLLKEAFAN